MLQDIGTVQPKTEMSVVEVFDISTLKTEDKKAKTYYYGTKTAIKPSPKGLFDGVALSLFLETPMSHYYTKKTEDKEEKETVKQTVPLSSRNYLFNHVSKTKQKIQTKLMLYATTFSKGKYINRVALKKHKKWSTSLPSLSVIIS